MLTFHYIIWQIQFLLWQKHRMEESAWIEAFGSDLMPGKLLAKTQFHHSNLCYTHTCACRSCSLTDSSVPALWLTMCSSSSGFPSCCRMVSLSALSSTSERWALGPNDSLFWSRHLSRTWHTERKLNNSGAIKPTVLKPSACSDIDIRG